ncbi:VC2046/SO_2500 family protein [uncultured Shewanella sp.]|uniref:VC2046/SO_2500 family protein n=1 Tax=uncultured Shewanella sp. TaxID=173975 RepID=UPI002618E4C2|nr:VC2046/SO_2500 family protein [uncultured Shewanella sp.]
MQNTISLVNELSLGSRLNQAVEANRRGEFGLLLALLSAEQKESVQFQLNQPSNEQSERSQFHLPAKQRLVADLNNEQPIVDNSQAFHLSGTMGFRLQDGLMQEALVVRSGNGVEFQTVMDNCDYHTQKRADMLNSSMDTKAVTLIEQLTTQRQMSQLILQA